MVIKTFKEGVERKNEFIEAAIDLFCQQGYENTSINDIINKVNVSKGAFYHYFESKEDLLAIIGQIHAEKLIQMAKKTSFDKKLNAIEKINKLIVNAQGYRFSEMENPSKAVKIFFNQNNLKLLTIIFENIKQSVKPLLENILKQGVKEGVFKINNISETASLYFYLVNIFNQYLIKIILTAKSKKEAMLAVWEKADFYQGVMEKLLGVELGSFVLAQKTVEIFEEKIVKKNLLKKIQKFFWEKNNLN